MTNWQPGMKLKDIEKEVIVSALNFYHGNKTETSQSLGIAIRTIDNKLKSYKMVIDGNRVFTESEFKRRAEEKREKEKTDNRFHAEAGIQI